MIRFVFSGHGMFSALSKAVSSFVLGEHAAADRSKSTAKPLQNVQNEHLRRNVFDISLEYCSIFCIKFKSNRCVSNFEYLSRDHRVDDPSSEAPLRVKE